jgi:hypothetical protein
MGGRPIAHHSGEATSVDYTARLRLLVWNKPVALFGPDELTLDRRTLALVRVAALTAVGTSFPAFAEDTDAAVRCGRI